MASIRFKASISFAMFAAFTGCAQPAPEAPPERPRAARVQAVELREIVAGRRVLAEVSAPRTVRLLAEVPGTVAAIHAPVGAPIPEGRSLLSLATPDLAARALRVTAERERAERERDFACARVETDRRLAASGDLPADPLAAAEKGCDAARLAADAAAAAEREVGVSVGRGAVRAPEAGALLDVLVDVGQPVMPGTQLGLFAGGPKELVFHLPEPEARGLALGAAVRFEGGEARVREVAALASGPARLVEVRAEVVDGAEALPRHGGTLTARLATEARAQGAAAPVEALARDAEGDFVVAVEGGEAKRVAVRVGPRDGGWAALDAGPPPGTWVVVDAPDQIDVKRPILAVEVSP